MEKNGKKNIGKVLVLILANFESKQCDSNVKNLKNVFSDEYFITKVIEFTCSKKLPQNSTITTAQYNELQIMKKAIEFATFGDGKGGGWPNLPVIIVKDSSVSNVTSEGMKDRISYALRTVKNADLFFLTVWSDACTKQKLIVPSVDGGSSLNWTYQPTSTQAILYTPASRSTIKEMIINSTVSYSAMLNSAIASGKLHAVTFTPNIVDFDISLATTNTDYYKLNTCAGIVSTTDTTNGLSSLLFFIILVAVIIFTAYCLLVLGANPKEKIE